MSADGGVYVSALVSDLAFTQFQYAALTANSTDTVTPSPVERFGPIVITVDDPATSSANLSVALKLPHNVTLPGQSVDAATSKSLITYIPMAPGIAFAVTGYWNKGNPVEYSSTTTVDMLPIDKNQNVSLTSPNAPEMIAPIVPQSGISPLSRSSNSGISWKPTGQLLSMRPGGAFTGSCAGQTCFYTTGSELRFDRLAALGLTLDGPGGNGMNWVILAMTDGTSVDALLDPSPNAAPAYTAQTDYNFEFQITP